MVHTMTTISPLLKHYSLLKSLVFKNIILGVGENVLTFAEYQRWAWVKALLLDIR